MYGAKPSGPGGIVGIGAGIMPGMPGGLAMGGTPGGGRETAASATSVGDLGGGPLGGAAFGPLAALLSLAAVQSSAFAAWSLILRKGYGRKPRDRLLGAKPPASDTELSPMPADGGGAMQGAPRGWALRPPRWLPRTVVWSIYGRGARRSSHSVASNALAVHQTHLQHMARAVLTQCHSINCTWLGALVHPASWQRQTTEQQPTANSL